MYSQLEYLTQMQQYQRDFFQQPSNPAVNHILLKHKELTQALDAEYGALYARIDDDDDVFFFIYFILYLFFYIFYIEFNLIT
jgi:hypothetical protein